MKRSLFFQILILLICFFGIAIPAYSSSPKVAATDRVLGVIQEIEQNLRESKYQHVTKVRQSKGQYLFDCSGMATWVLKRSAPRSIAVIGRPNGKHPLAVHFYRKIAKIKPGERRGPWHRVKTAAHIAPGDVIAWVRPKWFPSKVTGHVAFVLSHAKINNGDVRGFLVRIADASRYRHENDSRSEGETGFGTGVLLIPTDENDQPTGYGWFGSRTREDWVVPTELVIGRPLR